jgi:hypothetical protein
MAVIADAVESDKEERDRLFARLVVEECVWIIMNQGMFIRFNELAEKIEKDVLK